MMDGVIELAKMLKERENPSIQGVGIGKIEAVDPELKLKFNGFILTIDNIITLSGLIFEKGDSVIVIPSVDNSKYYIIGKVG